MNQLPFSVYDFFGYLSAGFLLMAAIAAGFVGQQPFEAEPNLIAVLLLVVVAYATGHVLANLAGFFLEALLLDELIGRPTERLFAEESGRLARIFPGYFRPLPPETRCRVLEKAAAAGITERGQALFYHCHALVKKEVVPNERLSTFINLYGFCRNCCLALLIAVPVLAVGIALGTAETGAIPPGWWLAAAGVGVVGLFYRYLKFFRLYAVEVFVSYAERP